ncbi:reverse transcriptase domain-containing protein [Tanacetum coccineum]
MADTSMIELMQEEPPSFDRLDLWNITDPLCKNVLNLKWALEKQTDEENTIIRNKARLVANATQKAAIANSAIQSSIPVPTHRCQYTSKRFKYLVMTTLYEDVMTPDDWRFWQLNLLDPSNINLRHFKTLSLDELRSPDFNLLSDQEYSEEEVAKTMAETMEQYMSKTRADYGSGVARPKIEDKDNFKLKDGLKTKFLNKYCPPARTTKKMEEINNFQQETDENLYQACERFKELLMKCPQHYLTEMQAVILFYNRLGIPTRQILDSRGAIPSKIAVDTKVAIKEMAVYSPKWHNGTSRSRSTENFDGLAAIQAQLNNLGREIKKVNEKVYAAQVGCEQCKGPHYTKDCPLKEEGKTLEEAYYTQMSKVLQERGFGSLPSSTEANPRDQVKSISTTIEADSYPIRRIRSSQYAVSTRQNCTLMYETRQTTISFPSRLNGYYYEENKRSYGPKFSEAYSKASQSIP